MTTRTMVTEKPLMTTDLASLLERLVENSKDRGWFFLNTSDPREIEAVKQLAAMGRIEITQQDVRIDHVTQRARAGEFVGVVLP